MSQLGAAGGCVKLTRKEGVDEEVAAESAGSCFSFLVLSPGLGFIGSLK